jgi:hypothetical protein
MDYLNTSTVALSLAEKSANLRIFDDVRGKMKRSPPDVRGSAGGIICVPILDKPNLDMTRPVGVAARAGSSKKA